MPLEKCIIFCSSMDIQRVGPKAMLQLSRIMAKTFSFFLQNLDDA